MHLAVDQVAASGLNDCYYLHHLVPVLPDDRAVLGPVDQLHVDRGHYATLQRPGRGLLLGTTHDYRVHRIDTWPDSLGFRDSPAGALPHQEVQERARGERVSLGPQDLQQFVQALQIASRLPDPGLRRGVLLLGGRPTATQDKPGHLPDVLGSYKRGSAGLERYNAPTSLRVPLDQERAFL